MVLCMAFLRVVFDLAIAMLLFGLLGVMFVIDECHVAIGLLVASIIFIMMLVDIMFWSMMLEMMLACGSYLDS